MSAEIMYSRLEQVAFTGLDWIDMEEVTPWQPWMTKTDMLVTFHSKTGKFAVLFDAPPGSHARIFLAGLQAALETIKAPLIEAKEPV